MVLLDYFVSWQGIYPELAKQAGEAPLVNPVLPYAKRIQRISDVMVRGLNRDGLEAEDLKVLEELFKTSEDPARNLDVEFAPTAKISELAHHLIEEK